MVPDDGYRKRVQECEAELLNARRAIDRVLARLRDLGTGNSNPDPAAPHNPAIDQAGACTVDCAGSERSTPCAPDVKPAFLLSYCEQDHSYRVGSRRIALTEMERGSLDLLWRASPRPTARDLIASKLSSSPGSIEVLVSKLRQKLALMSNGHNFIESVRLQGWVLRGPLCDQWENGPPPEVRVGDAARVEVISSGEAVKASPIRGVASAPDGHRAF